MKRFFLLAVITLSVFAVAFSIESADAQVITVRGGKTVTVSTILNVNCNEILIEAGGTLDLQGGTLDQKGIVTVDPGGVFKSDSGTIVTCSGNEVPEVTAGQNFTIVENSPNTTEVGTVSATDADGTTFINWAIADGNVDGVFSINDTSGKITVADNTKLDFEATKQYSLFITVSDGTDESAAGEVVVTISDINEPPVLGLIGNKTVNEQVPFTFKASVTDEDLPGDNLTFSLTGTVPSGASITPSGDFSWTPTEAQGPGVYTFNVVVNDNEAPSLSDFETITVTVDEVNKAPVLAAIGNRTLDEQTLLSFSATATDADLPLNTLTYSLSGTVPSGASITPSGDFSWTPSEAQGPGVYTFDVVVDDNTIPGLNDFETITVTVGEVNKAPVLAAIGNPTVDEQTLLSFSSSATDTDLPANSLTYSLSGTVPSGASITSSGDFSWTPTEAQGPGVYTFNVVVDDNKVPGLSDFETITVTVDEVNTAPVLDTIGDRSLNEETLLSFSATATDSDLPANTLTYSLSGTVPAGASITTSGDFSWTPSEAQGPGVYTFDVVVNDNEASSLSDFETISVTVDEANLLPVLDPVGDKSIGERQQLSFTPSVTDNDLPVNTLTFYLDGKPAGATFDSDTGDFSWTPTLSDVGTYNVTLRVNDGTGEVSEAFSITVTDVNYAPQFTGSPLISGTPKKGFVLDLIDTGTFDDDGDTVVLSYQWKVDGVDLPGSFSDTLTVSHGMQGKTVSCAITADDTNGGVVTFTTSGVQIYKFNWWIFHEAITSKSLQP